MIGELIIKRSNHLCRWREKLWKNLHCHLW